VVDAVKVDADPVITKRAHLAGARGCRVIHAAAVAVGKGLVLVAPVREGRIKQGWSACYSDGPLVWTKRRVTAVPRVNDVEVERQRQRLVGRQVRQREARPF